MIVIVGHPCQREKMNDFITIDFETATKKPESAISIGLVRYRNFRPIQYYYSLIRPPNLYIRPDFTDIHGLTVDDVKYAEDFSFLWEIEISPFIGPTTLAAHNASFDMKVLKAVLNWYKIPIPGLSYFCTLDLAQKAWPKLKSYKLAELAKKFKIKFNHHNALDDALTCGKLIQIAKKEFDPEDKIDNFIKHMGVKTKSLWTKKQSEEAWEEALKALNDLVEFVVDV
jgi:DNA polymerase III subunit epsilon